MYDVIIVGAGLSGLTASFKLSENGFNTLLIDYKKRVGKPIVCGEYLPYLDEIAFALKSRSIVEAYDIINKYSTKLSKTNGIKVCFESVREFSFDIEGFVIDREQFQNRLLAISRSEVVLGERVTKVELSNREILVKTDKGNIFKGRYLVGADGYPSTVAKKLELTDGYDEWDWAINISTRATLPKAFSKEVYMFISPKLTPGGYGWVIPRGERYNIGLGVRKAYLPSLNIINVFKRFKKRISEEFGRPKEMESKKLKPVPVGGVVRKLYFKNVLLVGDAAGLVNPINGGGIFTAIASGLLAAEAITNGNTEMYYKRVKEEIKPLIDVGLRYRKLVDKLFRKWNSLSFLVKIIPVSMAKRILKGENIFNI